MSKIYDNYIKEFGDFLEEYDRGLAGPGKIGAIGCRFTQYLAECGKEQFAREILYNIAYRDIIDGMDTTTGKPMAAGKAQVCAEATDSYRDYKEVKNTYASLEQMIGSLSRLQRGSMSELGMAGN